MPTGRDSVLTLRPRVHARNSRLHFVSPLVTAPRLAIGVKQQGCFRCLTACLTPEKCQCISALHDSPRPHLGRSAFFVSQGKRAAFLVEVGNHGRCEFAGTPAGELDSL